MMDGVFIPIYKKIFATILVTILLLFLGALVVNADSISLSPSENSISSGSYATYQIILDNATKGIAGYEIEVSLSDPAKAEIVSVSFPGWGTLNKNSELPSDKVTIGTVDLNRQLQQNSVNVMIASVTIRGDSLGSSSININIKQMDADGGDAIDARVIPGKIIIINTPSINPSVITTPVPVKVTTVPPSPTAIAINDHDTRTATQNPGNGSPYAPTQGPSVESHPKISINPSIGENETTTDRPGITSYDIILFSIIGVTGILLTLYVLKKK